MATSIDTAEKESDDTPAENQTDEDTGQIHLRFLCKLGMKPHMHLVKTIIFLLHHVIVRPTKIFKDLKDHKTLVFKAIFGG